LLLEPPDVLPADLERSLDEAEVKLTRRRSTQVALSYFALLGFMCLLPWMHVRSWPLVGAFYGLIALLGLSSLRSRYTGRASVSIGLVGNLLLAILFTRIAGPFMLTPVLTAAVILGLSSLPWISRRPWIVLAWVVVATLLPITLEALDLLPGSTGVIEGKVVTSSTMFFIHGELERLALLVANLACLTILTVFTVRVGRHRRDAQRQLHIQAWHLSQLLPGKSRAVASHFPMTIRESRRLIQGVGVAQQRKPVE
jgi:hypothetical protein